MISNCKKINTEFCKKCYKENLPYYDNWLYIGKLNRDTTSRVGNPIDPRMVFARNSFLIDLQKEDIKMNKIKIYLNTKNKRRIVNAELLKTRATTILVRLPDGNVIVRKKNRDVVKEEK